ncbi:serine-rich adhesin for platelets-like [Lineus longissimus]|uniref:serine-rich adhesin for platelets-like n=1 Tax=Lineus longissimus TaxID=88925 RepID=UPI00315CA58C
MDDLRNELQEVKKELGLIEQYLQEMLERQNTLVERKVEIESLIKSHQEKIAEAKLKVKAAFGHEGPQHQEENFSTSADYPWNEKLKTAMKDVFNMEKFRPLQEKTINATMSGRDCILIMPTGGGKSLCFQLPAVISDGVTLVISPLVSLMEDQLMSLQQLGVNAALLNASSSKQEVKDVQEAMISKNAGLKLLYVTPEKVSKSKRFMAKVEKMYEMGRLARIAIDEVHCCSLYGHDFRPDYKILGILKRQFPGTPVIGLTATATTKVIENVKNILNIPNCVLFKASFNRPNLFYEVRPKLTKHSDMMSELQMIIRSRFHHQSGIIYCFSKKDTADVCHDLQRLGVKAGCYHADMDAKQRSYVHRKWLSDEIHVVVATIAFGMGIDKPNVRFVIHHSISKSMENYYQESGRAGRDDQPATCIVFFRFQDMFRQSTMVFTEQTGLKNLYKMISYCIDCSKCRRTQIARYFDERWDSSQCNRMCDYCRNKDDVFIQKTDMASECRTVLEVLETASMKNQKLTGLKVMDAVMSKLKKTSLNRDDLEVVLVKMILDGYLREDFHFTPYSTISYMTPGAMAQVLSKTPTRIMMDFVRKKQTKRITDTTSRPRMTSTQGSQDSSILKPKLSIVNPKKSKFTTDLVTVIEENGDETKVEIGENGQTVESSTEFSKSARKKRKSYDLSRDSGDDNGFDFGDDVKLKPCKVSRIAGNSGSSGKATSASGRSKKRRADEGSDDSDCVVQSSACDIVDHSPCSPAKLQKLSDYSACRPFSEKVRNSNGFSEINSICKNGLDDVDGGGVDDVDGRRKLRCCITIDDSDNDELDGLGDNAEELFEQASKDIERVNQSSDKKGAKKQKMSAKLKSKFGRRQVYVVSGEDLEQQTVNMSGGDMSAVSLGEKSGVLSADTESLTTKSSLCSDGLHCGEDSDSDEAIEKESVRLGRYAVRYTKDAGQSGPKLSPVKMDQGSAATQQESVHSSQSSVHSSQSSVLSSRTTLHSSQSSKQTSDSSLHASQSSVYSSEVPRSSDVGLVSGTSHSSTRSSGSSQLDSRSGTTTSRTSHESKRSRSKVKVKPGDSSGPRSHREFKKVTLGEVKSDDSSVSRSKDSTKVTVGEAVSNKVRKGRRKKRREDVIDVMEGKGPQVDDDTSCSTSRAGRDKNLPKVVVSEVPVEVEQETGDDSVDSRARRRRRQVKKSEFLGSLGMGEKPEGASSLTSTGTSDSLEGSNSKAIVRGVFKRLRSRGLSDESSTFSSTSSRESTLTFQDDAISGRSLTTDEPSKKSKAMSKSLKPSFKPFGYFEKPLGEGGARPKVREPLPVLKKSKEFDEKILVRPTADKPQARKDSLSKSYAFGDGGGDGMFKSWAFRQRDSSSSTTSDTTTSSARVSQESLHSVKSIESEVVKSDSEDDMEETIQSPKLEQKFAYSRRDTTEKVGKSPLVDSTISSTQGDMSVSSGHGDTTASSSMEMSELYNIYAKQLDTLDVVDSSSESEAAKFDSMSPGAFGAKGKRQKSDRLRTLTQTVEKCAILEQPDTDDSLGSAGSVEKSMFNLENLPVVTRDDTSRKGASSDSDGDLEDLRDVYLDQLHHMKR